MKLLDVLTAPWAIVPEKLLEIQNIYATHLRGDKIDIKAIEAQLGRPLQNERKEYENRNGVGIIRIDGVLARRANLFMRMSGGTSTELAMAQFREALADREARAILFVIDSPGGTVDGTQELAEAVFNARGRKPIKALATGIAASAAYWIGAAADDLFLASDTTLMGSIGVVATHVDVSRAEDRLGVKTTEITAGKYKRIASQYAPLTQEGRASIQEMVDQIYTAFVNDVAHFRGVSVGTVLDRMADGRLFVGQKAIEAGLADGFTVEYDLVDALQRGRIGGIAKRATGAAGRQMEGRRMNAEETIKQLTSEQLKAGNPELAAALVAEGHAAGLREGKAQGIVEGQATGHAEGYSQGLEDGRKVGAAAERARIKAVEEQALPGHADLIEHLKWDGQTTGEQAAIKVLQAEKATRDVHLAKIRQEAPAPVVQATVPAGIEPNPDRPGIGGREAERDRLIKAHMASYQVDYRAAAFAVSRERPDLFKDR